MRLYKEGGRVKIVQKRKRLLYKERNDVDRNGGSRNESDAEWAVMLHA